MHLQCPSCARSYSVTPAELGETGRTVICPNCHAQWFAARPGYVPSASNDDLRTRPRFLRHKPRTPRQMAAGPSALRIAVGRVARSALAVGGATCVIAGLVTQREPIVRHAGVTAPLYAALGLGVNVRGLAFAKLEPVRLPSSDIAIKGLIRNVVGRRVGVPRVAFEVCDAAGTLLLSWSETLTPRTLAPGGTAAFISSPHHIPASGTMVTARFASDDPATPRQRLAER